MSLIRLTLLLLILGGVTLFALQNWLPVLPLVILGTQTQALPLAAWMVGSIALGAITTLIIAVLFRISNAWTVRWLRLSKGESRRAPARRAAQPTPKPPRSPEWNQPQTDEPMDVPFTVTNPGYDRSYQAYDPYSAAANSEDDWEQSRSAAWDDWEEDLEPTPPPAAQARPTSFRTDFRADTQTVLQNDFQDDRQDDFQEQPDFRPEPDDTAEPQVYYSADERDEREEWEDWEDWEEPDNEPDDEPDDEADRPAEPARPIYEIQQEPKTRYQSGSVYSYSYRDRDSGIGRSDSIRDVEPPLVEPRVIVPPYQPETKQPDSEVQSGESSDRVDPDTEDWGFEDEPEDDSRRKPSEDW